MAPSLLVCVTMIVATIFAIIGNNRYWQMQVSKTVVIFISVSILMMGVADFTISLFYKKRKQRVFNDHKLIEIELWKIVVFSLFGFITIYLQYQNVILNTGSTGSLPSRIYQYRRMYNTQTILYKQSPILSNMIAILTYSSYIFAFVFIHNMLKNKKKVVNYYSLIPIIFLAISGLLDGARGKLVNVILAAIFYLYFLYQDMHCWKKKYNYKMVKKIATIAVIGIIVFIQLGSVIGREDNRLGIIHYLCMYIGGEILLLDKHIATYVHTPHEWGQCTFTNIYIFLENRINRKLPNVDGWIIYRSSNGNSLGNVYTAIAPWYNDFGFLGIVIFSFLFCIVFSFVYRKLNRMKKRNFVFWLIIYGHFINCLFLFMFNDRLFSRLGPSLIKLFFYFYLLQVFILDFHIKKKRSK